MKKVAVIKTALQWHLVTSPSLQFTFKVILIDLFLLCNNMLETHFILRSVKYSTFEFDFENAYKQYTWSYYEGLAKVTCLLNIPLVQDSIPMQDIQAMNVIAMLNQDRQGRTWKLFSLASHLNFFRLFSGKWLQILTSSSVWMNHMV